MIKRILFFSFILLFISVVYYFFFQNKRKNNKIEIVQKEKILDSTLNTKSNYVDYLFPAATKNQIIHHKKYSLSYSEINEQAEWVAYKLFKNSVNNAIKRKDNFREDLSVKTGSATLKDYINSGYDRGHLAPAKSMSYTDETMSESFYMSNMSPQNPSFNRGVWKKLEEEVRSWISISDSLYIVTGPVLKNPIERIGESQVTVPRYYYKSIIRFKNNELFGIGFLLKNEKSTKSITSFTVSIDSIEKVTGLDFFHHLDTSIQNQLESNTKFEFFLKK